MTFYSEERLREARDIFYGDSYATKATGVTLEAVGERCSRCELILDGRHYNAYGGVMGGVAYTLADFAFAVASNYEYGPTVSLNGSISYTGVPKGKKLIAECSCLKEGRSTCLYEICITDDLGNSVAHCVINGFHK